MRPFSALIASLAGCTVVAGLAALRPQVHAQLNPAPPAVPKLPIKTVALFNSGVGYFSRESEIDGNAQIDLTFPVRDVNDLLKSMTLRDFGGGVVDAVTYDSQAPLERTLQSFALDLNGNPSQAELLAQARGEKVEVVVAVVKDKPETVTGAIVGVEARPEHMEKGEAVEQAYLNLLTSSGLRSFPLKAVYSVRFLNTSLDTELKRALDTVAAAKGSLRKQVSLVFRGAGKRTVRVGYVVEAAVWKTSYRLALTNDARPFLQGWAIVENPTDEDWTGVRMALVSGRPVSFKMDLYQPLYMPRPIMIQDRYAMLRPQNHEGEMPRGTPNGGGGGILGGVPSNPSMKDLLRRSTERGDHDAGDLPADPASAQKDTEALDRRTRTGLISEGKDVQETLELQRGVAASASAAQLGDSFQYLIQQPVTLPRQKSALLPIVQQEIDGQRVSIYNSAVHPKFPLLGLRLKNATTLNLMGGPVTLFDNGIYAGDARLPDLQPGEERLLSYAIDLGTEVETQVKQPPQRIVAIKVVKGVITTVTKLREEKLYTATNRSATDRTLLIEHPFRPEYTLQEGVAPSERSREQYRFQVKLPARGHASVPVIEERETSRTIALSNVDLEQARFLLTQPVGSAKLKAAVEEAIRWQEKLATVHRDVQAASSQLSAIEHDQTRLRENLKAMPQTATAYKRYLDKFDTQETEWERLQAEVKRLQSLEAQQRGEYERFLAALTVE